jgi:hypothetical protein
MPKMPAQLKGVTFVKPTMVYEVRYLGQNIRETEGFTFKNGEMHWEGTFPGVVLIQPSAQLIRDDKVISPTDLRLEQIPEWVKAGGDVIAK